MSDKASGIIFSTVERVIGEDIRTELYDEYEESSGPYRLHFVHRWQTPTEHVWDCDATSADHGNGSAKNCKTKEEALNAAIAMARNIQPTVQYGVVIALEEEWENFYSTEG